MPLDHNTAETYNTYLSRARHWEARAEDHRLKGRFRAYRNCRQMAQLFNEQAMRTAEGVN